MSASRPRRVALAAHPLSDDRSAGPPRLQDVQDDSPGLGRQEGHDARAQQPRRTQARLRELLTDAARSPAPPSGEAPCPIVCKFQAKKKQNCAYACGKQIEVGDTISPMAGTYMHSECALNWFFPGMGQQELLAKVPLFAPNEAAAERYTQRFSTGRSAIVLGAPGSGKSAEMVGTCKTAGILNCKPMTYNKGNPTLFVNGMKQHE